MENFEIILIKNLLENRVYFNKVKPILNKSIFSNIGCGEIFGIAVDFYNKYSQVPSIQEVQIASRDLPNAEIRKQISQVLNSLQVTQNINTQFLDDYTVQYVKNQLFEKALMVGADFIDKKSEASKTKAKELIDASQKVSICADLGNLYSNFDERLEYYQNPEKGLKYSDFEVFNQHLGEGILKGTLNLFLAPPGIGKSMMIAFTISDFLKQRKNILLVSMEMSNFEFMKRIDCNLLDISIFELKNKTFDLEMKEKFAKLKGQIGELYVQNYNPNTFSAYQLDALLDMYKSNGIEIDLVFLDYLGIMKSDLVSPNAGLYSYIKSIGEEVRAIARTWNIPVFSCSQLNRSSINKDTKDVDNSAISDSMGSAMTADLLVMLIQTEAQKEKNEMTFKITKNRYSGRTVSFKADVDYRKMRFLSPISAVSDAEVVSITEIPKITQSNSIVETPSSIGLVNPLDSVLQDLANLK